MSLSYLINISRQGITSLLLQHRCQPALITLSCCVNLPSQKGGVGAALSTEHSLCGVSSCQPSGSVPLSQTRLYGSAAVSQLSDGSTSGSPQVPVLIAGGGVSGLVMALELARHGIKSLILERSLQLSRHPRAHYINNRTMEIFRSLGGLAHEVSELSPPLDEWRKFVYCRSVAGGQETMLGEVDHFKDQIGPQMVNISPEPVAHLPQSRLLDLLMQRARAQRDGIQIRMGLSLESVQSSGGIVKAVARDSAGQAHHVSARYLVAADGAHSLVRSMLGIGMEGEPDLQHLINVHFFSRDLAKLAAQRPAMLYFVFNSDVVLAIVAHDISKGEFVAQVPYFPPLQSLSDFPPQVCISLLRSAAGVPDMDVKVEQVKPWTMTAQVAERFHDPSEQIFLVGDAAHRFPPAGGFGMNTGIQDAHNLAWKMAAVLHGTAGPQLLSTYEAERKAVALSNTALSVSNWNDSLKVPSALGLNLSAATLLNNIATSTCGLRGSGTTAPDPAGSTQAPSRAHGSRAPNSEHRTPQAPPSLSHWGLPDLPSMSLLPVPMAKALLEGTLALGRNLSGRALWSAPLRPLIKARIDKVFASGETLRLQYPKEDLGFKYNVGAILPTQDQGKSYPSRSKPPRGAPFVPSAEPGCRLPHCWLRNASEPNSEVVSTLDLAAAPHLGLLLIADGVDGADNVWVRAALSLSDKLRTAAGSGADHLVTPGSLEGFGSGLSGHGGLRIVQVLSEWEHAGRGGAGRRDLGRPTSSQGEEAGVAGKVNTSQGSEEAAKEGPARVERFVDIQSRWGGVMGLPPGTAMLVRPDGHVAGHLLLSDLKTNCTAAIDEALQVLERAYHTVLCLG